MKDVSQHDWQPVLGGNPLCTGTCFQTRCGGSHVGAHLQAGSVRGPGDWVQPSTLPSNRASASSSLLCLGFLWLKGPEHLRIMEQVSGEEAEQQRWRMTETKWFLFSVAYSLLYLRDWRRNWFVPMTLLLLVEGCNKMGYFSCSGFCLFFFFSPNKNTGKLGSGHSVGSRC